MFALILPESEYQFTVYNAAFVIRRLPGVSDSQP